MDVARGAVHNYPLYALINRFAGDVDAQTLFRTLAETGKVRFADNVKTVLFVQVQKPAMGALVVEISPVSDLLKGDTYLVLSSHEVSTLLTFIFSDEGRANTVLPKTGQVHILSEDDEGDYTIVIFWNDMRHLWEIQKFDGDHHTLRASHADMLLGYSHGGGKKLAIAA